jgi:all-trans-8'-apo-beta-carotenal 15,15'-oxygenase
MNRRQFLVRSTAAAVGGLLPNLAWPADQDPWADGFAAGLNRDRYLSGFAGISEDTLVTGRLKLEGEIPAVLRGTFYRNGPARYERGGVRYHHWFDGDGMVHAFRFSENGVSHVGRFVRTEKYVAETAAGKFLLPAFGTRFPDAQSVSGPDSLNVANTNVLAHAGQLFALWEGGSAHVLDPVTIEALGPKTWRDDLKGMPFSAHPKLDQDGTLWNFGIDTGSASMVLYQISSHGALVKADAFTVPGIAMVHDFAITAKHLVFLLPPFKFDPSRLAQGASFLDCHEWLADAPLRVLTVDKGDWTQRRFYELPTGFLFHLGNAWEEGRGAIRFDCVRADDPSVMTAKIPALMRGIPSGSLGSKPTLVTLDPSRGTARQEVVAGSVEFPRVDPRYVGRRYRQLYSVASTGETARWRGFNAVLRRDLETGKTDAFDYGEKVMVEEHIVVPQVDGNEGAGWAIGTALDVTNNVTLLSVFDALDLAGGPIARATLPYALPLGFHGNFAVA